MERQFEKQLRVREVALLTNLSESFLNKVRLYAPEKSPPFVRHGRSIRYPEGALRAWLARRLEGGTR